MNSFLRPLILLAACGILAVPAAHAARQSDVRNTKHNLSSSGATGNTKSSSETQVCVFCHTPHAANASAVAPLWNRKIGGAADTAATYAATYTPYNSESLDARMASIQAGWSGQPLGSSKLCLSCHDGTIALGNVINAPGSGFGSAIEVGGSTSTTMPAGTEGYTRNLGQNLANDHPISITYSTALTNQDGELRPLASMPLINGTHPLVGTRGGGQGSGLGSSTSGTGLYGSTSTRPVLPLETTSGTGGGTGQMQCTTCHDPHIRETTLTTDVADAADITKERNIKFLRRNRFQMAQPSESYSDANDIVCLSCHQKGNDGTAANSFSWAYSSHANSNIATQAYTSGAADTRQFPQGMPVWKVACLNCHDTHTVSGARRLTRQGASSGVSKLEETCYQCHRLLANSILGNVDSVPDIYTDFQSTYKMPLTNASEIHDIGGDNATDCPGGVAKCGADMVERQTLLANRHAECTDCHNPHRVVRLHRLDGKVSTTGAFTAGINPAAQQDDKEGTHFHKDISGYTHNNVASGVLRGAWGVEPLYTYTDASKFNTAIPQSYYTTRRGDPGSDSLSTTDVTTYPDTKGYVTREYQVCLKCHSSYAYGASPPTSGTSIGINGLTQYTDQAREFHAPAGHDSESTSSVAVNLGDEGGAIGYDSNNHRSWHPVMKPTGRTASLRSVTATSAWRLPWSNAVGSQTMYCSDCHGSNVTSTSSVVPNGTLAGSGTSTGTGSPWGPHGSANPFILKGPWHANSSTSSTAANTAFCLKCHNPTSSTGFSGSKGNLHQYHIERGASPLQCTWCHIAVPHGWKNKSLLVNLNDVGEEAGFAAGSSNQVAISGNSNNYTQGPYYLQAKNKIRTFARPGNWEDSACGTSTQGVPIIANSQGSTSNSTGSGRSWMRSVCGNPP
ncbi:MAG: hypothetical protein NDI91_06530 [Sulfuritalea sp.]|nr:hypothetical protein [Sulfuritalea sp.]